MKQKLAVVIMAFNILIQMVILGAQAMPVPEEIDAYDSQGYMPQYVKENMVEFIKKHNRAPRGKTELARIFGYSYNRMKMTSDSSFVDVGSDYEPEIVIHEDGTISLFD